MDKLGLDFSYRCLSSSCYYCIRDKTLDARKKEVIPMRFMEKVILLTVVNLIWFIVLCIYGMVCSTVFPALGTAANSSGVYAQTRPIWVNIQTFGWIGLIISGIGSLIYLLLSSHQDEYEQYREYNPQENNRW